MTDDQRRSVHPRTLSVRWRLSLTYAGIAALTALVLGGILLGMLSNYFSRVDDDYARSVATRAAENLVGPDGPGVQQSLLQTAFGTNTRVQAFDASGKLIADSGPPQMIDPNGVDFPTAGGQKSVPRKPPAAPGSSSVSGDVRSNAVYTRAALPQSRGGVASIEVSEGVSSGGTLMRGVVVALVVAALCAVAAAALLGYWISSRITRPLLHLAAASDAMAAGNLGVRADIEGNDEIGRLARSFNEMSGRVEVTVAALRRFASDAAHQLGTPLTALRTDLEVLRETSTSPQDQRLLDRALLQEQRLEALGSGLLQLSRLESPDADRKLQAVDVGNLISVAADAFASRAEQAGLDLDVVHPQAPVLAIGDPERLREAVENLLDNAVKFTPSGGSVQVGVRCGVDSDRALIWVSDTGPGISTADRERVFERFYRARDVADRPGSGLGLAIVQAAVQSCGGTVRLVHTDIGTRIELLVEAVNEQS
ncbi:MAG: HAMP domain-containing sensor histidine kinase [Actinomycetes bacterium]